MSQDSVMFVNTVVVLGKCSSLLGKGTTTNSLCRHLGFGGRSPRGQSRESWRKKKKKKSRERDTKGEAIQLKRNCEPDKHAL
jgi:hypothetical protein